MIPELELEVERLARRAELVSSTVRDGASIKTRGRQVVNFSSWDYLGAGLTSAVKRAAQSEIEKLGVGVSSSRLASGTRKVHLASETCIARFLGLESALLFSSRNQAVFSLVTALGNERDAFFVDELNQSPVVDAACLIEAQVSTFRLGELDALEKQLSASSTNRRRFIFLETLSPMTGKIAPLREIVALAERFDAQLVIDESFALVGVGVRGGGVSELAALPTASFCTIASLAFGVGCYGAFIAGPSILSEHLLGYSRTFAAEAAFPPLIAGAIEASLNYVELQNVGRESISKLAGELRDALLGQGFDVVSDAKSPVVCIAFDTSRLALEFSDALFHRGILVEPLIAGIPRSEVGIVRSVVTSRHTAEDIKLFIKTAAEITGKIE